VVSHVAILSSDDHDTSKAAYDFLMVRRFFLPHAYLALTLMVASLEAHQDFWR